MMDKSKYHRSGSRLKFLGIRNPNLRLVDRPGEVVTMHKKKVALAAIAAFLYAATSTSSTMAASLPHVPMAKTLGKGEGTLNLIVWAGYAENGSNDKAVDWVNPFTTATGCKVNGKTAGTSDEMVSLMKTGGYDGVSASGDGSLRMIYGGQAAPVNTALVPNYSTISPFLKNQKWNSVNGTMYGIPHGWGANVLAYNAAKVKTPTSWSAVFDANSPYKGKITAYDSPI